MLTIWIGRTSRSRSSNVAMRSAPTPLEQSTITRARWSCAIGEYINRPSPTLLTEGSANASSSVHLVCFYQAFYAHARALFDSGEPKEESLNVCVASGGDLCLAGHVFTVASSCAKCSSLERCMSTIQSDIPVRSVDSALVVNVVRVAAEAVAATATVTHNVPSGFALLVAEMSAGAIRRRAATSNKNGVALKFAVLLIVITRLARAGPVDGAVMGEPIPAGAFVTLGLTVPGATVV